MPDLNGCDWNSMRSFATARCSIGGQITVAGLGANLFHGFRNYHCLIKSASKNDQS